MNTNQVPSTADRGSELTEVLGLVPEWSPELEFSERAIDRFVYSQEPAGEMDAEFRLALAEVIAEAVAAERERCAQIVEREVLKACPHLKESEFAALIRA